MKILHRGQPPEDKEFTVTCSYCKSVLKFSQSEARESNGPDGLSFSVKCPVCGSEVLADAK